MGIKYGEGAFFHDVRCRNAGDARHNDDIALAVQLIDDILSQARADHPQIRADFGYKIVGLDGAGAQNHRHALHHSALDRSRKRRRAHGNQDQRIRLLRQQVFDLGHLDIGARLGIAIEQLADDIFAQMIDIPIGMGVHQSRPGIARALRGESDTVRTIFGELAGVIALIEAR